MTTKSLSADTLPTHSIAQPMLAPGDFKKWPEKFYKTAASCAICCMASMAATDAEAAASLLSNHCLL